MSPALQRRPHRAHEGFSYITLVLSDDMLFKNANAQESSGLCSLPCEILELIWEDLNAACKVILMMTCKHFAKIGKLRNTKPPPPDCFTYYWMLSKLASWMPRSLKLCGKCRMYRMRATEQYQENDWCALWLQERWRVPENNAMIKYTDGIFMCPLHRIDYRSLQKLVEVERDVKPLPATHLEAVHLPSDGTGGLAVKLHYRLNRLALAPHQKEEAGAKRRRSF
jgi:hypothetical protein